MSRSRARKNRRNPQYKFYRILEADIRRAKSFEELMKIPVSKRLSHPGVVVDQDVTFLYPNTIDIVKIE